MKKYFFIVFLLFLLISCNFNEKKENNKEDIPSSLHEDKTEYLETAEVKIDSFVCCFFAGGYKQILDINSCMQKGLEWTNDLEMCNEQDNVCCEVSDGIIAVLSAEDCREKKGTERLMNLCFPEAECCCEFIDRKTMFVKEKDCLNQKGNCVEDKICISFEIKKIKKEDTINEVNIIFPDRSASESDDSAIKVCCLVPMPAYRPYDKALDTTRERCFELKGTALSWETCYEIVCCDRNGRLSLRKFMDCKTEMGDVVDLEKCKLLTPDLI